MYEPRAIIDTIAANVRRTHSPFGIPKCLVNKWPAGLFLPRKGESLLFTGLMYQFVPYIEKSTTYLAKYEDSKLGGYVGLAKLAPSYLSGIGLAALTSPREKKKYNQILKNIANILRASGVNFGYDPKLDEYSGILLYDLGDLEGFKKQARYVAKKLKKAGIKKLITVDPHTTFAFKELYPKYAGETFEVTPYFELVDIPPLASGQKVTLHDPCFYGRYLGLSDVPAQKLGHLGVELAEVRNSGRFTRCCGGPAESISPKLSAEVGQRRLEELNQTGAPLVAMCPVCLGNLRKLGAEVEDLSTILSASLN